MEYSEFVKELEQSNIKPISNSQAYNTVVDSKEEYIINAISQKTGVKYSDEQLKLLHSKGSMCVLACAGSGKTTSLVHLLAKRIWNGEIKDTSKLLCTTYSVAGEKEMNDRLAALLNNLGIRANIRIQTFHAFCLGLINTFGYNTKGKIVSGGKRRELILSACKDAEFRPKDDELDTIDNLLSYQINCLLRDQDVVTSNVNTIENMDLQTFIKIRKGYARKKVELDMLDFDDMQTMMFKWLVNDIKSNDEQVRNTGLAVKNYCKYMWNDIYIDEAQDISKIQFEIIRAIIEDDNGKLAKTITFIGDDDQCLPLGTLVRKDNGYTEIEKLEGYDMIASGVGSCESKYTPLDAKSDRYYSGELIKIKTATGKELEATPNHIGFARIVPDRVHYYTYLMYRHDFGFRIGTTSGVRSNGKGDLKNGIQIRLIQERADKVWIINVADSLKESLYYESFYAYKYSIPMYRFVTGDSGKGIPATSLDTYDVKKLHKELDTLNNGHRLLEDLGIDYNYPHYLPQTDGDRNRLAFSMFSSKQKDKYGVHLSELSINSSNSEYVDVFSKYVDTSKRKASSSGNEYMNGRLTTTEIDRHEEVVKCIQNDCNNSGIYLETSKSIKLTEDKFMYMPFGNMIVGMKVPIENIEIGANYDGTDKVTIVEDEIVSVEHVQYSGQVYDIGCSETRNFIANGVVVHNCIYTWRGADPNIILGIGNKYGIQTCLLSTNYRCKRNIVEYAKSSVINNTVRYDKSMNAFNDGGHIVIKKSKTNSLFEMAKIANDYVCNLVANGVGANEIEVMSRNNFHLSILNSMLVSNGIYSNINDNMKLTTSSIYKDIRILLNMCEARFNNIADTKSILWKLCQYLGAKGAYFVANFMDVTCLSLIDTLAYMLNRYNGNISIQCVEPNVPLAVKNRANEQWFRLSNETKNGLKMLYDTLIIEDHDEKFKKLGNLYYSGAQFMYKTEDKERTLVSMLVYIESIISEKGYADTVAFLRTIEQLESGSMIIPGKKVSMTTIHGAKGREWKHVIMFACDNVTMPSGLSISLMLDNNDTLSNINSYINEERRLHYVEATRAKEDLLVITNNKPSVFTLESLGLLKKEDETNQMLIDMVKNIDDALLKYNKSVNELKSRFNDTDTYVVS